VALIGLATDSSAGKPSSEQLTNQESTSIRHMVHAAEQIGNTIGSFVTLDRSSTI
jgi:hypothetical protein